MSLARATLGRQTGRSWVRQPGTRQTPAVHVVLVVNTVAASVTPRRQRRVAAALAAAGSLEVHDTTHRGHAGDIARRAVAAGADAIVVLGGDGTMSEVAAATVGTGCALAALPGGSTNVFARTIGLPRHPVSAAQVTAEALAAGSRSTISLGSVAPGCAGEAGRRHFALHTGVGWDAALVELVERRPVAKRRAGQVPFVLAGLQTFTGGYDRRRPHFSVTVQRAGHPPEELGEAFFSLVLNSDPYTFVGGRAFTVSPAADRRSALSVVTLTSMRLADFLPALSDALRSGNGVRERPGVVVRTDVCAATVRRLGAGSPSGDGRPPVMPYQVDGDHLGEADALHFAHHPHALRVVVPMEISRGRTRRDGRRRGRW